MGYLGAKYNLYEDYGMQQPQEQSSMLMDSASSEAPAQAAAGGAAMKANPYLLGGSFLLSYLQAKQQEFERKRQMEMQNQRDYANNQQEALNSLNNSWKSALLK